MVHIWYTEEPKPDKEGPNQTKDQSRSRPRTHSLFWSRLVSFGLAWNARNGLENRRPFTRSKGSNPFPSAIKVHS